MPRSEATQEFIAFICSTKSIKIRGMFPRPNPPCMYISSIQKTRQKPEQIWPDFSYNMKTTIKWGGTPKGAAAGIS